jgi:hypothetical protein
MDQNNPSAAKNLSLEQLQHCVDALHSAEGGTPEALRDARIQLEAFMKSAENIDLKDAARMRSTAESIQLLDTARSQVNNRVSRVLDWVPYTITTVGKPVARTVGATTELTLYALGHVLGGIKRGGIAGYQAMQAA